MGRAFGYLASFIAVVGGCVALVRWLDAENVPLEVIGAVVLALAIPLGVFQRIVPLEQSAFRRLESRHFWLALGLNALRVLAYFAVLAYSLFLEQSEQWVVLVGATIFFAVSTGPLIWDLYERDKASRKRCPDCCEEVKVGARVCRYCGHRWRDLDGW